MKQHIYILSIFGLVAFGGAEKSNADNFIVSNKAQHSISLVSTSTDAIRTLPDCPEGTRPVIYYEFNGFNFHRPIFDCKRGFYFCFKDGNWVFDCKPIDTYDLAYIDGTKAYVWAQELDNGKLEFHFPLALKNTEGYTSEDLATLNVDEEYEIYEGTTLKMGDYEVVETETELVVVVDTL